MNVFETISAQQGPERTAVWMVGEQLKDMLRNDETGQEMVAQDLERGMSLKACEKKLAEYAGRHKTGNFACVTPVEAEEIIREYFGLGKEKAAAQADVVDLSDFF